MMKRFLLLVVLVGLGHPAMAQETLSPVQQYLYSESGGYVPPAAAPQPVPPAAAPQPVPPAAAPQPVPPQPEQQAVAADPGLSPVQQYLYGESGYAPPPPAAAPVAEDPYTTAYVPPPVEPTVEDGYYEDNSHLNQGVSGMNF